MKSAAFAMVAVMLAGCGGRGGYDADRAMPWLEAQVREIERAQSEAHAAQLRAEQRAYDIERKLDALSGQCRK